MVMTHDPAGVRGSFYEPAKARPQVYLDERVYQYLSGKAQGKGVSVEEMVNSLLKKAIEISWSLER
jgi:hypothetical protein